MPIGDLITGPGQVEIGEQFVVGDRPSRILAEVSGVGLPSIASGSRERSVADGAYPGRDRFEERQPALTVHLNSPDRATLSADVDDLAAVMHVLRTGTIPLALRLGAPTARLFWVRPHRLEILWDAMWTPHGLATGVLVAFRAPDPYAYSTVEDTDTLTIPASDTSTSDTVVVGGNGRTRPTVTIDGPATNPRLTNATDDGRALRLDVVLGAADTAVVDLAERTATLNGTSDYSILAADTEWPDLLPGDNALTFARDDSPSTAATVDVTYRDAYLSAV